MNGLWFHRFTEPLDIPQKASSIIIFNCKSGHFKPLPFPTPPNPLFPFAGMVLLSLAGGLPVRWSWRSRLHIILVSSIQTTFLFFSLYFFFICFRKKESNGMCLAKLSLLWMVNAHYCRFIWSCTWEENDLYSFWVHFTFCKEKKLCCMICILIFLFVFAFSWGKFYLMLYFWRTRGWRRAWWRCWVFRTCLNSSVLFLGWVEHTSPCV